MSKRKLIIILFSAALVIRVAVVLFYSDYKTPNSYEYGALAENLINGNGYSLFYFEDNNINFSFQENIKPFPSAYMMPGYPLLISGLLILQAKNPYLLLFILQAVAASFAVVFLYFFIKKLAGNSIADISALIYSLMPEMIYPVISVGPTVFLHLLVVIIFYLLSNIDRYPRYIYFTALLSLLLVYLWPAMILFISFIGLYFLFKSRYKELIIVFLFITIGLSPWIIRNYTEFDRFIPLTTSTGQNFFRGNNMVYPGYWAGEKEAEDIKRLKRDYAFELKLNDYFLNKGIENIKVNPGKAILDGLEKIFHLWVYYPYDSRTGNFLYLIPWMILLPFIFVAMFSKFEFDRKNILYFYLLSFTINSFVFFALLRYQTIMKIALIPLSVQGMFIVWDMYFKKNKTV